MRAALLVVVGVFLSACVSVAPGQTTSTVTPVATVQQTTLAPATLAPVTVPPITLAPVTLPPPTAPPVTLAPRTVEPPTNAPPTQIEPTARPGTLDPNATPAPTRLDVLPYLTSEIVIVNLTDTVVAVSVALLDAETDEEFGLGVFDLQPEQVTTQAVVPTRIRLVFEYDGAPAADARTCTIDIGAESIQFAVVATGIVITAGTEEPADAAEMVVATSSRCHAGDAT